MIYQILTLLITWEGVVKEIKRISYARPEHQPVDRQTKRKKTLWRQALSKLTPDQQLKRSLIKFISVKTKTEECILDIVFNNSKLF